MNVCKRFIEGLKDHNLTHEDIKSWKMVVLVVGEVIKHYFNLKFKDEKHTFTEGILKTFISRELL